MSDAKQSSRAILLPTTRASSSLQKSLTIRPAAKHQLDPSPVHVASVDVSEGLESLVAKRQRMTPKIVSKNFPGKSAERPTQRHVPYAVPSAEEDIEEEPSTTMPADPVVVHGRTNELYNDYLQERDEEERIKLLRLMILKHITNPITVNLCVESGTPALRGSPLLHDALHHECDTVEKLFHQADAGMLKTSYRIMEATMALVSEKRLVKAGDMKDSVELFDWVCEWQLDCEDGRIVVFRTGQ